MNTSLLIDKINRLSDRIYGINLLSDFNNTIHKLVTTEINSEELAIFQELFTFYTTILHIFITLGVIGFFLNLFFFCLIAKGTRLRLFSRKRYCLVLSRTAADTFTNALTVVWTGMGLAQVGYDTAINIVHIMQVSLSFWSVTGNLLALAIMTFLAAKYPLYYKTKVTIGRCLLTVIFIWVFAILLTAVLIPVGGTAFFSHVSHYCSISCQMTLMSIVLTTFVVSFVSVPVLYLTILLSLRNRTLGVENHLQVRNYWRLGMSIASYTLFNCPFVLLTTAAALLISHYKKGGHKQEIDMTVNIFVLRMVASLLLIARTIIDPLLSAALDYSKFKSAVFNDSCRTSTYGTMAHNEPLTGMYSLRELRKRSNALSRDSARPYRKWSRLSLPPEPHRLRLRHEFLDDRDSCDSESTIFVEKQVLEVSIV